MRRAISRSHALSTPSSTIASRLSIKEHTKSARSSSGRASAFCSRWEACSVVASFYLCPTRSSGFSGSERPVLCRVQDSYDKYDLACNLIDDHIWQRRNHQFTRSWLFAWASAMGESFQYGGRVVDSPHQLCGIFGRFLKQLVGDVFQVVSGSRAPAKRHQTRLCFSVNNL